MNGKTKFSDPIWSHFDEKEKYTLQWTNDYNHSFISMKGGIDPILDFWLNEYPNSASSKNCLSSVLTSFVFSLIIFINKV